MFMPLGAADSVLRQWQRFRNEVFQEFCSAFGVHEAWGYMRGRCIAHPHANVCACGALYGVAAVLALARSWLTSSLQMKEQRCGNMQITAHHMHANMVEWAHGLIADALAHTANWDATFRRAVGMKPHQTIAEYPTLSATSAGCIHPRAHAAAACYGRCLAGGRHSAGERWRTPSSTTRVERM